MTGGGAEINFGGHEEFIFVNSRGAQEVYSSVDQTKKVKTKKKVLRFISFMKSSVSPQKLRKKSSCSRILGR